MKDGSALLTQLLDDLNRTKTSLTELERECATLREENTRFRKERSEVVEKIAASLDTVSDTLLRFRDGPAPVAALTNPTVEPEESPGAPPPNKPRDPHAPHILIVDDDTSFRNMLALPPVRERRVRGHVGGERRGSTDAAHHPSAAGRRARLMMPGMGGMEALRRMKAQHPGLCVVTVTAYEDLGGAHEVIALGAADYLKKPFKLEHLDALLNLHLSRAHAASLRN
jgi:ActR/RegA family two-component response regulator